MSEVNRKTLKRALKALKTLCAFAHRDCYYGLAAFKFLGNTISYSSRHGATVGVYMPMDLGLSGVLYVPVVKVKMALELKSDCFDLDPQKLTLNGVQIDETQSICIANDLPLDFRDKFGAISSVVTVPVPSVRKDLGTARGIGDIRSYLNGLCYDLDGHAVIATDGHRMHLANSDTLPPYGALELQGLRRKFKNPDAEQDSLPVRVVLLTWLDNLLDVIDAKEFGLARFPELRPDEPKTLGGWGYPDVDSLSLILNAKSDLGFLVAATFDGQYPNWPRVVPTMHTIEETRSELMAGSTSVDLLKAQIARTPYDTSAQRKLREAMTWRGRYPRKVRFTATTAAALRAYAKARLAEVKGQKSKNPQLSLGVALNFRRGVIEGDPLSAIVLNAPFEVLEDIDYPPDFEESSQQHLAGLNAIFLADAIDYVGPCVNWHGAQEHAFVAHAEPRTAVVMTCRL